VTGSSTSFLRFWLSTIVFVVVSTIGVRGMAPTGAGVYYDDGVYLALAQSLADGHGYTYANLPGDVPGIKYPPVYPVVLAVASKILPAYPANLSYLKALNALLIGLAAVLTLLAFTRRRDGTLRLVAFSAAVMLGYSSAQTLALGTVLLSEPLFLVLAMGTLLAAGRNRTAPLILGFGAAAVFLTRSVGVSVIAAVLAAELLRENVWSKPGLRRAGVLAGTALGPAIAWWVWTVTRLQDVPQALAGSYGSYVAWYGDEGSWLGSVLETVQTHWTPLITAFEQLWIPDATVLTANFVLIVLTGLSIIGLVSVGRRNSSLAMFPVLYLTVVLVWPYEPDRFFYAIIPLVTMFVVEGGAWISMRIRQDMPKWGLPIVALVTALLLFNSVSYQVQSHRARVWTRFQMAPEATYRPLLDWIQENTPSDAVVASGLDPLVYWETGRKAIPNFQFLASDYLGADESTEVLAAQFEELRELSGARWVAVIRGEGKAGRTMDAFVAQHPGRARAAFESTTAGYTGVVYEVLPPGEVFPPTSPTISATPPSPQ